MASAGQHGSLFILGLGNTLLSDDGVGVHVVNLLEQEARYPDTISFCEGGTLGLNLLPDIEKADSLIVVDAANLKAPPGTVAVFVDEQMDEQLGGKKSSAHEVALEDLVCAARLTGNLPKRRALVAVQPETTEWGLKPTEAVEAAIPVACDKVKDLIERWSP